MLHDIGKTLAALNHQTFEAAKKRVEDKGEAYFRDAVVDVDAALKALYGQKEVSTLQLSATFRRGDLIQKILDHPLKSA